ncbi:MAG: M1 family aminopeptidase, partial [Pseudomonadota bacterium]
PLSYDVALKVDPRETSFRGIVSIDVWMDMPSDGIWIHGDDLDVAAVSVNGEDATYEQVLPTGVSRIIFAREMPKGPLKVRIAYSADFDGNLAGLFRVEEQGDAYALAKSESIQARRFLPGFDEPVYKAPFDMALVVPTGYAAISNTPIISRRSSEDEGFDEIRFETTRPLSTYLLSVAVGPFDVVEYPDIPPNRIRQTPLPLRGFARRGRGDDLRAALDTTADLVSIFETEIGQPYPYAKLDIVAAPQWPSGATELAGAITYRESRILLDENSGPAAYRSMLGIHTHELAHMWFGNLVTPPWWDDLWLKEAFATWGTPLALKAFEPEAGHDIDAVVRAIGAMRLDSLAATRAVREDIGRNADIRNAYDAITYSKGMAVIAMADAYFGAETFRPALGRYIAKFADSAADSPDFYEVIGEVTGEPAMASVFQSFVEQKGVPLVTADVSCQGEEGGYDVSVMLKQSRYRPLGSSIAADTTWTIPVCVGFGQIGENGPERICKIIDTERAELLFGEQASCPSYVMPNAEGAGYFRWSLEAEDWSDLVEQFASLSSPEALSAVDSAVAAFEAGAGDVASMLAIFKAAASHPDRRVATAPIAAVTRQVALLGDRVDVGRAFAGQLYRGRYESLKDPQSPPNRVLKAQLENFLANVALDNDVRADLASDAAAFIGFEQPRINNALSSDRYVAALTVAVQDLGHPFFDALMQATQTIDDPRFEAARAIALGRVEDPELVDRVRRLALEGELGSRETYDLLVGQMAGAETRDETWAWIQANYTELIDQVPRQWRRRTPSLAARFCDRTSAENLEAFFDKVGELAPGHERALAQTEEAITLCSALRQARSGVLFQEMSAFLDKAS